MIYYQNDLVTLHHGDCLEVMPEIEQPVNVILTDPPFFMPATHYSSRTHWQRSWGDTGILASFWKQVLIAAIPTLKPEGHFISFCDGASYPVFYPETYRRFDSVSSLVWNKGRIGMGSPWRNQHELIIAARWKGSYRSDDRGQGDVFTHPPVTSSKRLHPVDKPVELLAQILSPVTPAGGLVLDPFAGGGSTLLAAALSGLKSIGIESEERYCEVIAKRLSAERLNMEEAA